MICLHATASLDPRGGGPPRTIVQLTDSLAAIPDLQVILTSQIFRGEAAVASKSNRADRRLCPSDSRLALKLGLPVRAELWRIGKLQQVSLVHNHGVWLPVNHWAARVARYYNIPLIIHPRGMLEPWAMNYNRWKKKLAMFIFQQRDLITAKALVATSQAEYESIRRIGLKNPVALIPNGVEHAASDVGTGTIAGKRVEVRTALFLSRVHEKKGLLNLIRAWGKLKPEGWRLCIAGPDEGGHLAEVMTLARELNVVSSVRYVGVVDGAEKSALYCNSDLFVLPTYSENFGVVVAEALAHGLPVITTKGAPWADLETYGCGWWIDIGVDPLVVALQQAIALTDEQRQAMAQRGRQYVRRYNWQDIGQQTADVYRWLLGQGPQPNCIRLD